MIRALVHETNYLLRSQWLVLPLIIVCIPILYLLGEHCIYMWDEAIYANNAIEMLHSGDWFVIQNNGVPSHYNVKPPLVTWMQSLTIMIFGVEEWAFRLPSALSAIGIVFMMLIFSRRWLGDYYTGIFASIFLVSAFGFVRVHLIRSGDLDAVLLLFTTSYTFLFIDYLVRGKSARTYLPAISVLILLAFFAKSLAGLLPLFPLTLIALLTQKGRNLIGNSQTWLYVVSTLVFIFVYYLVRDIIQPGYFELVWNSEFLRLTHNVMPWHEQPANFYLFNFVRLNFFNPHIFIFLPAVIFLIVFSDIHIKKIVLIIAAFCLFYLLFISIPVVKLEWYDAPFYPFAAFLLGLALWKFGAKWNVWFFVLILTLAFPYREILIFYNQHVEPTEPLEKEGNFMNRMSESLPDIREYRVYMEVLTPEHLDQMLFYQKKLNWFEDYRIDHIQQINQISIHDTILCCQSNAIQNIELFFKTRLLAENSDCRLLSIEGK